MRSGETDQAITIDNIELKELGKLYQTKLSIYLF